MKHTPDEIEDRLLVDESLSQIVRVYESAFPKPLKNTAYSRIAFVICSLVSVIVWNTDVQFKLLSATLSNLVDLGISLSGVALGLGLAGVAIYTSSLKPHTLEILTRTNYPKTTISALRFILSTFVYVIVAFLKLVIICVVYYLLISEDSFVLEIISKQFDERDNAFVLFSLFYLPFFFYYFVFAFSNLWSFVLNLHRSILIIAATEVVILGRDEKNKES